MWKSNSYNEQDIIRGCIENNRKAQKALYQRHFPVMMGMCMRHTTDESKALEMVNAGFLRVFQKIKTYKGKGSLQGWIRKIIYHSISDYYRKNKSYHRTIQLEDPTDNKTVGNGALQKMYFEDLVGLLQSLPEKTKLVFKLHALEGYTHHEIAAELDISIGTSKWHVSDAKSRLRKLIKDSKTYHEAR